MTGTRSQRMGRHVEGKSHPARHQLPVDRADHGASARGEHQPGLWVSASRWVSLSGNCLPSISKIVGILTPVQFNLVIAVNEAQAEALGKFAPHGRLARAGHTDENDTFRLIHAPPQWTGARPKPRNNHQLIERLKLLTLPLGEVTVTLMLPVKRDVHPGTFDDHGMEGATWRIGVRHRVGPGRGHRRLTVSPVSLV